MKKKMMYLMLITAMTMMTTACSSDDPFSDDYNNWTNNGSDNNNSGSISDTSGGSSSGVYSEMSSFTVALDKTTEEPATSVAAAYPEENDNPASHTFSKVVNIDMANPVDPVVEGVTITIDGNHVTASHGSTEGVCYVVTGKTANGSLTIDGKTNFELNLNNASITNTRSTAIDIESKKKAFLDAPGDSDVPAGKKPSDE